LKLKQKIINHFKNPLEKGDFFIEYFCCEWYNYQKSINEV